MKWTIGISDNIKVPIMGCGGIVDWRDAVEFMMAGASSVQIGTAIAIRGPDIFRSIIHGIRKYLNEEGLKSVNEIVGLSHRR